MAGVAVLAGAGVAVRTGVALGADLIKAGELFGAVTSTRTGALPGKKKMSRQTASPMTAPARISRSCLPALTRSDHWLAALRRYWAVVKTCSVPDWCVLRRPLVTRIGHEYLGPCRDQEALSRLHAPADALGRRSPPGLRFRARGACVCACGTAGLLPADRLDPGGASQLRRRAHHADHRHRHPRNRRVVPLGAQLVPEPALACERALPRPRVGRRHHPVRR